MSRILIIGGIAAGMKAAATAKRRRPELDILVLQDEAEVSYSACGLPYWLAHPDDISRAGLIARSVDRFRGDGIDLRTRHRVEEVDLAARRVRATMLETGDTITEPFDQVLFATGAKTIAPRLGETAGAPPVLPLRSMADADRWVEHIRPGLRAVVIGGGYIGLEMAEALRLRGMEVTVVEAASRLLPSFDPTVGAVAGEHLVAKGVDFLPGFAVTGTIKGGVALSSGTELAADLVLSAIGVRPRVDLAAAAGVRLGETGAIAVDAGMRAGDGVFAAGDCAEAVHRVSGKAVWYPLGDIANRQGRVAGENLAGGEATFPGVLGTAIFKVFDLAVGRTGLNEQQAREAGFDPVVIHARAPTRARYMPSSRTIDAVLLADRKSGRLIGAEAIGSDHVDKYVDTLATAIWGGLGAQDLADLDLAYAPPFSPVFAPAQIVGQLAVRDVA